MVNNSLFPTRSTLALAEEDLLTGLLRSRGKEALLSTKAGILGLAYHLYLILPWEENQFIPIDCRI
uniref:Uncharacterized protein n=1 Tax=Utricularia reniformis TaxID=192314 RepID=A0A1Y0B4M3_9LAMI|nr:hypothetical protein AEK19_MT2193 [Utricularia reniformis]ART32340.1 hypothetical protein AEK19_MT2193 [Utricularia reniformis]